MSTTPITFERIDQEIRALAPSDTSELLPAQLMESLDRLLLVYDAVRSLLLLISALGILPPPWRAALTRFIHALESVAASASASKDFKAGKDL